MYRPQKSFGYLLPILVSRNSPFYRVAQDCHFRPRALPSRGSCAVVVSLRLGGVSASRGKKDVSHGGAMCFFVSLIPATIWVVLGYFILFSSTKTLGAVQQLGRILAIWVFIIAAFFPVMGAYVTFAGLCPSIGAMMKTMHSLQAPKGVNGLGP